MIFGATGLLFLLNGTIRKHIVITNMTKDSLRKLNFFYVNDFYGGDTSFEMTIELYKKLRVRFTEGYFNLRKCRTNDANLRKPISETGQNDIKP